MFGWIFDLIGIIKALIGLWNEYKRFKADQRKIEEEWRRQEMDKALDAAVKAKTPKEAWDAQTGIVDNSN